MKVRYFLFVMLLALLPHLSAEISSLEEAENHAAWYMKEYHLPQFDWIYVTNSGIYEIVWEYNIYDLFPDLDTLNCPRKSATIRDDNLEEEFMAAVRQKDYEYFDLGWEDSYFNMMWDEIIKHRFSILLEETGPQLKITKESLQYREWGIGEMDDYGGHSAFEDGIFQTIEEIVCPVDMLKQKKTESKKQKHKKKKTVKHKKQGNCKNSSAKKIMSLA